MQNFLSLLATTNLHEAWCDCEKWILINVDGNHGNWVETYIEKFNHLKNEQELVLDLACWTLPRQDGSIPRKQFYSRPVTYIVNVDYNSTLVYPSVPILRKNGIIQKLNLKVSGLNFLNFATGKIDQNAWRTKEWCT